jgi:hypothetical protein
MNGRIHCSNITTIEKHAIIQDKKSGESGVVTKSFMTELSATITLYMELVATNPKATPRTPGRRLTKRQVSNTDATRLAAMRECYTATGIGEHKITKSSFNTNYSAFYRIHHSTLVKNQHQNTLTRAIITDAPGQHLARSRRRSSVDLGNHR